MKHSGESPAGGAQVAVGGAVLVAVLAAAFNLRIAVVAVGPVIDDIQADTGMDSAAASLLVALPFACFGVFSFTGAALIRRFGSSRLIAACLFLLAIGTALRAAMPTPFLLILATVPIGVVIALISVALPGVVKQHFSASGGTTTGFYASSINVGGVLAALTVVPIAELVGGWRWAFALSAIPAAMALAIWFRADTGIDLKDTDAPRIGALRPPSHGVMLGVIFGLQAMVFAGLVTWIAAISFSSPTQALKPMKFTKLVPNKRSWAMIALLSFASET